ncbi:predicted protein [Uncinocarpus reesii 1704]|uniref:Uncharacterized protein n=1 Tax=Uncinocarpus reesii (strain UAMH 1704) TaxID=336963 RepID=C4JNL2_UNCRE|nr:uncharacterized protein UREG_03010 [Uncinocarpus reesii 1704]EEP78165.1 predicted protein [Uncinocarpus reesii 1704]
MDTISAIPGCGGMERMRLRIQGYAKVTAVMHFQHLNEDLSAVYCNRDIVISIGEVGNHHLNIFPYMVRRKRALDKQETG